MRDKRFDLGHGDLQLLDELFPLLSDEQNVAGGEQEIFVLCAEELVTDRLGSARICWHWWVCSSALVSGASSLDIQGREGLEGRFEASRRCVHTRRAR